MVRTIINENKLWEWCEELPHCEVFFKMFFLDKEREEKDWSVNLTEYINTLVAFKKHKADISDNDAELMNAFYDIAKVDYNYFSR